MEPWSGFILGTLGGLHCAGMCGPLLLALPGAGCGSPARFAAGRLIYQAGRVATYGVLGMVFGLAGGTFRLAGVQEWVSILLGAALLAGLFVSPRFLELPWIVGWVTRLRGVMAGFLRRRSWTALGTLGALNGLLPCGLVYAACAGAAAAGGWVAGGLFMLAFGAGTLPVTLGISLSGRVLPASLRLRLRHAVPVGVALMGCLLILRGLALGVPYLSPASGTGAAACHPVGK